MLPFGCCIFVALAVAIFVATTRLGTPPTE
jgi:hypothetical protein